MAIDVKYGSTDDGRGWSRRSWTNADGNSFALLSTEGMISVSATISRDSDIDTLKAQLNMAIQDWRTYRAKEAKRNHAGTVTNKLKRD